MRKIMRAHNRIIQRSLINTSSLNFYRPDAFSFQMLYMPWPCVGLSQVSSAKKAELISWVLAWELPSTCATMCYKEVWVS